MVIPIQRRKFTLLLTSRKLRSTNFPSMKSFFKTVLATMVGIIAMSIIGLFIMFMFIGVILSSSDKTVAISSNSILELRLDETIADRASDNPLEGFNLISFRINRKLGLADIIRNIHKAAHDPDIKGIYMNLSYIPAGLATIDEIRNALLDFKKSGKFIITYGDVFTQPAYYLASVSDSILLNPAGVLTFVGMRAEVMFFKGTLEKLGLEPEVIRHGKFKSAVEPFINDKMSKENREQISVYANSIWNSILGKISKQRHISIDSLNYIADNLSIRTTKDLVRYKLVDALFYKDELISLLKSKSGIKPKQKLRIVSLGKYDKVPSSETGNVYQKDKIAIIYAMGEIIVGEGQEGNMGSDRISAVIRQAREDTMVKAIVLRVNSGGGSALASEVIWREVKLAREKKPVVASLGDVAASGGYYIVCDADSIIASPNTLTGSIGVFGLLLNAQKLFNNKLGITTDVVKTNKYSDFASVYKPLSSQEREVIQAGVEDIYTTFIEHVAEGRKMTSSQVDSIGQGRVWSGVNAKKIGLIDSYGSLEDAIKVAARMAKIEHYRTISLPQLTPPMEQILKQLYGESSISVIPKEWQESFSTYFYLKHYMESSGIQARIPAEIRLY
jgi:protease IV